LLYPVLLLFACLRSSNSTLFPYTTLFRSRDVAKLFPVTVFMELMGMDLSRLQDFRRLAESFFGAQNDAAEMERLSNLILGEMKRSEEHTSELQSRENLVCRLLLEKKNTTE